MWIGVVFGTMLLADKICSVLLTFVNITFTLQEYEFLKT